METASAFFRRVAILATVLISLGSYTAHSQQTLRGDWTMQADKFRGQNGKQYTITFPPGGTLSSRLWGTDLYTDDSSIGTAAVHAGLITLQNGGTVTIEIRAGASAYQGSTRNGVKSNDYGAWTGSFAFLSGTPATGGDGETLQGNWTLQADKFRGQNGKQYTIAFPPGGTLSSRLWGTDLYTDDSSIGTAAVHAGLITPQNGGTVTIEIRAGASAYQGSTRNGVKSNSYGSWSGSFVFVRSQAADHPGSGGRKTGGILPGVQPEPIRGDWALQADKYRGQNGKQFTIAFPPGGNLSSRLWGTGLYTDDSSIGTAAVHAGLITPQNGGTVTIEIRAGASSYQGSTRNGVKSNDYGTWGGSFVFVDGLAGEGRRTGGSTRGGILTGRQGETIQGVWTLQADKFRGQNGKQYTIVLPPGGTLSSRLWGTGLYTDDSSIGTAAVHAGLVTPENGGTVTIEIRAGASSYQGSTRNGVKSNNYGTWSGSFVFVKQP